jgi:hypothetical protein
MANGNDMATAQSSRYETPTFDPRGAFSWTQRGGEMARLEAQRQRDRETTVAQSARYETPKGDPRSAFSWTLRSGEIAGRERQQRRHRLAEPKPLDVLVAA